MIIFLDTNIVIYIVENTAGFGPRAQACYGNHLSVGNTFAVSELVRMEARVLPIRTGNTALLAQFDAFIAPMQVLDLTKAVCERATLLRATYNFKTADALQLAAAIVHSCDRFLTNDTRLSACTDITVEVLP